MSIDSTVRTTMIPLSPVLRMTISLGLSIDAVQTTARRADVGAIRRSTAHRGPTA